MTINFGIVGAKNSRVLKRDVGLVARKAQRTSVTALNQVCRRTIENPVYRDVAASVGLPLRVVRWLHDRSGNRTSRRRVVFTRATVRKPLAKHKLNGRNGLGTVKFVHLGAKETRTGVRAGRGRSVRGGFLARGRFGRDAFVREGRSRGPLDTLSIPLEPQGNNAFQRRIALSGPAYNSEFNRRMNVEMNKDKPGFIRAR